jgi:membrane protein DedA with SNARE-associated domain
MHNSISLGTAAALCFSLILLAGILLLSRFGGAASGVSTPGSEYHYGPPVDTFEHSLAKVQPLLDRYGYAAAFAANMAEGMGIPMPGQILLILGALAATKGQMNITLLLFFVLVGTIFGNSIGYAIGRWGGRAVLEKLKVNPQRQRRCEEVFAERGGLVILLARFLDGLRQLNGIVAGVTRMPWGKFTAYNIAGALLWTCAWGLGAYYFGQDIHVIAAFFHRHRRLLYVLSATAFVALMLYLLRFRILNR